MPCRLRRVVPALVAIAASCAALSAADAPRSFKLDTTKSRPATAPAAAPRAGSSATGPSLTIAGPRGSQQLTVALDDLAIDLDAAVPTDLSRLDPRIASVSYGARQARIALRGVASAADLDGIAQQVAAAGGQASAIAIQSGSSERTILTREIVVACAGSPDALAARHGCRVVRQISPGIWLFEATAHGLLAGAEAAKALAGEAGVTAELQVRRRAVSHRTPDDPLFVRLPNKNDNLPVPLPGFYTPADPYDPGVDPPVGYPYGPLPWDLDRILVTTGNAGPPIVYSTYIDSLPWYRNTPLGDHGQWHLKTSPMGMNCQPVWQAYTGDTIAVTVVDTGIEATHEDLSGKIRQSIGWDRFTKSNNPGLTDSNDYHGTTVAGLIVANEGNSLGGVGTAFGATVIPYRYLTTNTDTPGMAMTSGQGPTDAEYADSALFLRTGLSGSNLTYVSNNSWGYGGLGYNAPGTAGIAALQQSTLLGRLTRGVVFVFSAGNDMTPLQYTDLSTGSDNFSFTLVPKDTADYNGYINPYTIGVGALNRAGRRASYSETGPCLLVTAPGGDVITNPYAPHQNLPPPYFYPGGVVSTDRSGYISGASGPRNGIDPGLPTTYLGVQQVWNWAGDYTLVHPYLDPIALDSVNLWPFQPIGLNPRELAGTSFAAANVSGVVALMLEARPQLTWRDVQHILARRSRKPVDDIEEGGLRATISNGGITTMVQNLGIRDDGWLAAVSPAVVWSPLSAYAPGLWFPNDTGMTYNLWYGYGAVNATKAIYGDSTLVPSDDTTVMDPDATQLTALKARYDSPGAIHWPLMPVTAIPETATFTYDTAATDWHNGIVPAQAVATPDTNTPLIIPLTINPASTAGGKPNQTGLVAESVELHVKLSADSRRGDLAYILVSPKHTIAHIVNRMIDNGQGLDFTFTLNSFWNEDPAGTWQLFVIDICNPVQDVVTNATLTVHGHLPYRVPTASSLSGPGVAAGVSSTIQVNGTGFAKNANGEVTMTTGIWYENPPSSGAVIRQRLAAKLIDAGTLELTIPSTLANASTSPGTARIRIGNPELPLGQNAIMSSGADAEDRYQTDTWETANAPIIYTASNDPDTMQQRLKMAGGNATPTELTCKYSRPPTITVIPDILLPPGTATGTTFTQTFTVTDPDIDPATINPGRTPEDLTIVTQVFNQSVVNNGSLVTTLTGPLYGHGTGTYTLTGTVIGTSGLSMVQLGVTDGVTTTIAAFRVGILAKDEATGCGGGMGLALLGTPLAVWLLRRRRRN